MDFGSMKDKVTDAAGDAKDKVVDVAGEAKEKVSEAAGHAKEKVSEAAGKVKEAVTTEEGTDRILDKIEGAAKKVTGGKLDEKIDSARDYLDSKLGDE